MKIQPKKDADLLNLTHDSILVRDLDDRIVFWNHGAEETYGWTEKEALGKVADELLQTQFPKPLHDIKAELLLSERWEGELVHRTRDSARIVVASRWALKKDQEGNPDGIWEINRDISEHKQAKQALRESEEHFRELVQGIRDYAIFMLDPDGRVLTWNDGAERIKGYRPDEIIGKHFSCFYPKEDVERGKPDQGLRTAKIEGRFEEEGQRVRKDGSLFWANVVITAWRDDAGNLRAFTKVTRDITERKRAEEELVKAQSELERKVEQRTTSLAAEVTQRIQSEEILERSESWLRSLIAATQDAVLSIDRRGCVVLFNPAAERIFGYAAAEIVGRKVNKLMAEPYASEHDGYIERYERTGEAHAIGRIRTVTAKRKNGELFPIELSVTEIEVDKDVHYAAFIRDISEKAKLQEQLVERERLATIGTTAAKIGHELANPLNGLSLTIQLLQQRLSKLRNPPDSQVMATIQRLKNEISRLNQLASQFRTISRRENYDLQPTELAGLIDDVIKIQQPHLAQLNIEVEQFIPADLPTVAVDKDKIKQALLNLVKNAAEAMPGGGKINIGVSTNQEGVFIDITDTGTGIPPDIDAFEPFLTTKKDGTGIGLVIVRQIVVAHGGKISYRSRPGESTTFRIELPRK
jgi:two-component system, LuxR family, sensor kinase FixL